MPQTETSVWDVDIALPISTSVLYPLAPLGLGTPLVESLSSYLKRLAHAHHLKVADLVTFCGTQIDTNILLPTVQKLSRIDGITDSGQAWSALLQTLTCREEVRCLTMNYWRSLLNPYLLLRQYHAWCPQCFEEAAQQELPLYEPLAWRLQATEVCLVHRCSLVEVCSGCGNYLTTLSHWAVVGYCPKCQSWLGNSTLVGPTRPCAEEACQRTEAVGRLLSLAPRMSPTQCRRMSSLIPLLKQRHCTTYSHLAQVMRTAPCTVSDFLVDSRQPNLAMFSRLAVHSGELFWQALTEPNDTAPISKTEPDKSEPLIYLDHLLASPHRLLSLRTIARQCRFDTVTAFHKAFPMYYDALWQRIRAEQRQILEQALQQEPPVVLSKWAQQHGYETDDLYTNFYDLCKQVVHRFHVDKHERCRAYLGVAFQNQALPTLAEICQALGVSVYYLKQHFADELQVIEAKRQEHIDRMQNFVKEYLDGIVAENEGNISLQEVAQAVGKSTTYLRENFPSQSQVLLSRRRAHIARQVQTTCDRIRQTVFELHRQGIYPSVDRIHAAIDGWMVRGNAYRRAYIEAITQCGYLSTSSQ